MTTKVTIDAHAGWPVQVEIVDQYPDQKDSALRVEIVPPKEVRDFYVHDSRHLIIRELKKEG